MVVPFFNLIVVLFLPYLYADITMDNIQVHYITLLKGALEQGLLGKIGDALDILLELRLHPDLALWTRARVNLGICAFTHAISFPRKAELAQDALRLAKELDADENPEKDAYWATEYKNLLKNAEVAVKQAEDELANVTDENRQTLATKVTLNDNDELIELPRDDSNLKNPQVVPWQVEGAFTLFPAGKVSEKEVGGFEDTKVRENKNTTQQAQDTGGKTVEMRLSGTTQFDSDSGVDMRFASPLRYTSPMSAEEQKHPFLSPGEQSAMSRGYVRKVSSSLEPRLPSFANPSYSEDSDSDVPFTRDFSIPLRSMKRRNLTFKKPASLSSGEEADHEASD